MSNDSERGLERAFAELRPSPDSELEHARAHAHRSLFGPSESREAELDEPLMVGRYRLLANVGRGGQGHVWAAHDPQLDRVVVVKLLHRQASAQLLAEARVMIRLTHPNVIRVYDVGDHDGELFVAMEYVEGRTLQAWQQGQHWRALLDVYLLAGEGLVAAHASGLVHGDFKSDNVLIGNDGRVLVSNFGVAPEQLEGRRADVLSDQFALCVSFWEALLGPRGPKEPSPSARRRIPARLLAILRRGLAESPSARHPDIPSLLAQLRRLRTRRRRWSLAASVSVLVCSAIAGLGYGLLNAASEREPAGCLLDVRVEWDADRRAALGQRLQAGALPLPDERIEPALGLLDRFADDWTSARRWTCALHEVGGGVARFEDRSSCLIAAAAEFEASLAVLAADEAKPRMVAQPLIAGLPDPRHCVRSLRETEVDPERAERLAALRRQVAQVRALRLGQQPEPALRQCIELLADAELLGDPTLLAAVELEHGRLLHQVGQPREGMRRLQRAASLATTVDESELALAATGDIASISMELGGDPREFEAWAERAVLLGERVGDPVATLHARLLLGRAAMLLDRPAESLAIQQAALEQAERELDPGNPELAHAHDFLAATHGELGHVEQAIEHEARAIAILERAYGPEHIELVTLLATAADVHAIVGRREQAEALFERSLAIVVELLGREHRRSRSIARRLAEFLFDEGRPQDAEALLGDDPNPWATVARAEWALDSDDLPRAGELIAALELEGARDDAHLHAAIFELRGRFALREDQRERAETMAEGLLVISRALGTREFELPALHIRAELELREQGSLTPATRSRLDDALARPGVRPDRAIRTRLLLWEVAQPSEREAMRGELERALASAHGPQHPLRRAFESAAESSGLEPDR